MTNFDCAAHLIMEAARESELPTETAVNAVEALAKAGLIMPDLPEPSRGMTPRGAVWYLNTPIGDIRRAGEDIVAFGHDCQDKPFRLVLNEAEADTIARTLLAAAKYQEEA